MATRTTTKTARDLSSEVRLKGDSYRLKDRDLGRVPAASTTED